MISPGLWEELGRGRCAGLTWHLTWQQGAGLQITGFFSSFAWRSCLKGASDKTFTAGMTPV
jgi:hypothetical protein